MAKTELTRGQKAALTRARNKKKVASEAAGRKSDPSTVRRSLSSQAGVITDGAPIPATSGHSPKDRAGATKFLEHLTSKAESTLGRERQQRDSVIEHAEDYGTRMSKSPKDKAGATKFFGHLASDPVSEETRVSKGTIPSSAVSEFLASLGRIESDVYGRITDASITVTLHAPRDQQHALTAIYDGSAWHLKL